MMFSHLHPEDLYPMRFIKVDKDFAKKACFKRHKITVKVRDIHKIQKTIILFSLVFLLMYQKMLCRKTC